ncbi:lipid A biosynthesis acyltransferase [Arcobacter nitrofigilis DSM 7299]|uniref:Lipid A biosynthesis acyltransferase n=1 Tax=Arcobacter nitrofigilis (strain ATCC 33309 / DSM 7299 / CCUG 15893 / LMG 7604 / NCTC 12251 / CI) TaxID=572480 RepID=D5V0U0_ARCNC|nr:lipid A biosynthesis lauroyl acyltransferase [Arcobacter nitrofigilis]ADG93902.1 lipid A biosynthesis acyltransferase [Arcobacter nitrofigilis DSM 7299]
MDNVYLFLFTSFRFLIIYTPHVILYSILDFLSYILFCIDKKHKKIAKANLDLAYEDKISEDEKIDIIKGCYKNLVYTLADFIRNQGATKDEILNKVTFKNEDLLTNLINQNRKIIIMTAHYGNWELLSLAIAEKLTPLSIVGRDLESDVMNKILTKNREQFDVELLSKSGAMKGMLQALKKNRPVGILVDQNTKDEEGILIDFFGKKARHTPSAAVLAKKFDAVIIPAFIKSMDNENYEIEFYESFEVANSEDKEKDILECVQKQADITEEVIKSKPNEWFWLHKRWKNQYEHIYK